MATLIAFATRNWKLIAGGLVALAFVALLIVKNVEISGLERRIGALDTQISNLQRDLGTCRANTATLQASIAAHNTALQRVEAAGAARTASLEQSLLTARRTAQTAREQANAILSRRPGTQGCEAQMAEALALIRGN